jgi:hypothetical protein
VPVGSVIVPDRDGSIDPVCVGLSEAVGTSVNVRVIVALGRDMEVDIVRTAVAVAVVFGRVCVQAVEVPVGRVSETDGAGVGSVHDCVLDGRVDEPVTVSEPVWVSL